MLALDAKGSGVPRLNALLLYTQYANIDTIVLSFRSAVSLLQLPFIIAAHSLLIHPFNSFRKDCVLLRHINICSESAQGSTNKEPISTSEQSERTHTVTT